MNANKVRRVLVVDDHEDARRVMEAFFRAHGFEVSGAGDGAQALQLVGVQRFDLVVLDLLMPVMDGHAFLRALRRDPAHAQLPVVVVSGAPEPQVEGAAASFAKPAPLEALLETVNRLVGLPRS
jgi:CheY-like chemotaxis protein